jgi:MFS family permease
VDSETEKGQGQLKPDPPSYNAADGRPVHGVKWLLVCAALYTIAFLYGLDTTIAADIQGPVIEEFGRVDQLAWIGVGFPLGSVAVQLLNGNLYAHFNLKWIFIGGIVLFEIGSVICGAAPNMDALIVGRVLAGAGGSAIYIGELNYFTLLTGPKERGLYISLIGLFWSVGAVIGPVVGGAFSESAATWRWAFYINLVIGAVAAPIYLFYLPALRFNPTPPLFRARLARFDLLGITLIGATWILFTITFTLAGSQQPWSAPGSIALLVLSPLLLLASIAQQHFSLLTTPATRAFPAHLLRSRTQILLFIATACAATSLFVTTYYIPIYFQVCN